MNWLESHIFYCREDYSMYVFFLCFDFVFNMYYRYLNQHHAMLAHEDVKGAVKDAVVFLFFIFALKVVSLLFF